MNVATKTAALDRRKRTLLPLLIVLFVISYGLLTMLVVQQSRRINSQSTLIHLLLKDSVRLSEIRKAERQQGKAQAAQGTHAGSAAGQTPKAKIPVIQVPSIQVPSTPAPLAKVPSTQVPSAQVPSQETAQAQLQRVPSAQVPSGKAKTDSKSGKAQKLAPKPPAQVTDPSDMRRVWIAI